MEVQNAIYQTLKNDVDRANFQLAHIKDCLDDIRSAKRDSMLRVIPPSELCQKLDISKRTLSRWPIPKIKINNKIFYHLDDVEKFVLQNRKLGHV